MSSNADILAKVIMDIKAILDNERMLLDIEKVLADELNCVGKTRNPGLVKDLLLVRKTPMLSAPPSGYRRDLAVSRW